MSAVRMGARCHHCGHYEPDAARALLNYAHCPSCNRHTRWAHPDTGAALTGEEWASVGEEPPVELGDPSDWGIE